MVFTSYVIPAGTYFDNNYLMAGLDRIDGEGRREVSVYPKLPGGLTFRIFLKAPFLSVLYSY
ncbi:MAG: hypothetical protein CVV03_02595 [Firmicutes bacterium HGW-Firmicutes-8]|nr:MAG: hypothetical protein CVV03_02595 [Firmicutes bacterium HGW-Firmicutes-8]